MTNDLKGKRVLVSGSETGVGVGIARVFARYGADVVVHYAHDAKGAQTIRDEILAMGRRSEAFSADFNDLDQVSALADQAVQFLGGVDVLVNNAGVTMNRAFLDTTPQQFDTLFNINIRAMYFLTQTLAPGMIERGKGAVVNLSSVHTYHGLTEHSVYAATKAAVMALTRTLGIELATQGVRMNAIAPGWIHVPNHDKAMGKIDMKAAAYDNPAGFIGQPEDVGELAAFLASDRSRYAVAQTYVLDGGQMSTMPFTGHFREPTNAQFGADYVPNLE